MDKKMLEELQKMQKQIADFEDRPSTLGDGLADLRNNKLPVNQLPEGVITGDVTADVVDSGAATEGQVLTANGEGGATWQDAGDGLPEITAEDEGKVLKVDSGAAIWGDAAGENIPTIEIRHGSTVKGILEAVGFDENTAVGTIKEVYVSNTSGMIQNIDPSFCLIAKPYSETYRFIFYAAEKSVYYYFSGTFAEMANKNFQSSYDSKINYLAVPSTSSLDSAKTYQLQTAGQGTPAWAEASSGGGDSYIVFDELINNISGNDEHKQAIFNKYKDDTNLGKKYIVSSPDGAYYLLSIQFEGWRYVMKWCRNPLFYSVVSVAQSTNQGASWTFVGIENSFVNLGTFSPNSSGLFLVQVSSGVPSVKDISLPNDAAEKTYILKAINGTLTWVEE